MRHLVALLFLVPTLCTCNQQVLPKSQSFTVFGTWVFEYELLANDQKSSRAPYMLLEYDYSDGIALFENQKGCRVYGGKADTLQQFDWKLQDNKLIVSLSKLNAEEIIYKVSNLTANTMIFETPNGARYRLKK